MMLDKLLVCSSMVAEGLPDACFLQIRPLPSIVRKLPISWLQEIVTAEDIITEYVANLYEHIDEGSLEGRSSMLVRSGLSQSHVGVLNGLFVSAGHVQSIP